MLAPSIAPSSRAAVVTASSPTIRMVTLEGSTPSRASVCRVRMCGGPPKDWMPNVLPTSSSGRRSGGRTTSSALERLVVAPTNTTSEPPARAPSIGASPVQA